MRKKHYEATVILKPEGGMDSVKQFAERVNGIVEKMEGKIINLHSWGEKKLAYEINKNLKGHFVHFDMVGTGPLISELERNFNIWEHVLKFMSIRIDKKEELDQLVASAKGIASIFEKVEPKYNKEEKVEKVAEAKPVEEKLGDNKNYNEKLQKTFTKSQEDEEDSNAEL